MIEILAGDLTENLPPENLPSVPEGALPYKSTPSSPYYQDYGNVPTTKERLERALDLVQRTVLNPFQDADSAAEATPQALKEQLETFFAVQRGTGFTSVETGDYLADELSYDIIVKLATEKKEADPFRVISDEVHKVQKKKGFKRFKKVFIKCILGTFDVITDILSTIALSRTNSEQAFIQGGSLLFSFLVQSFASYVLGQPWYVVLLGLVGAKPAVEGYRDATGAKPFPNQKFPNNVMLFCSRLIQITTEVIPQSLIQTLTLIIVPEARSTLSYISLGSSFILGGGLTIVVPDRELDKCENRRECEPLIDGYVPEAGAGRQMIAQIFFHATFNASKIVSLAFLVASSSFRFMLNIMFMEFLAFLVLRWSNGSWRYFRLGVDGILPSLFVHVCVYAGLVAAPFPFFRSPCFLSPRLYKRGIAYMLAVNFFWTFFAYHVLLLHYQSHVHDHYALNEEVPEWYAWTFLVCSTAACLFCGSVAFHYVPSSHKPSFYQSNSLKHHLATFYWNDKNHDYDLDHRKITDQDHIRALLPLKYSGRYTPKALLVDFYEGKWAKWCDDPPDWFDDGYREEVPRDLLVKVDESLWAGRKEEKEDAAAGMNCEETVWTF